MGIRDSRPSISVVYDVYLDNSKALSDIEYGDLTSTLDQFINDLKIKNPEYNCVTYYENGEDIIHILGSLRNNPVTYDKLLYVIEVVENYNSR